MKKEDDVEKEVEKDEKVEEKEKDNEEVKDDDKDEKKEDIDDRDKGEILKDKRKNKEKIFRQELFCTFFAVPDNCCKIYCC